MAPDKKQKGRNKKSIPVTKKDDKKANGTNGDVVTADMTEEGKDLVCFEIKMFA